MHILRILQSYRLSIYAYFKATNPLIWSSGMPLLENMHYDHVMFVFALEHQNIDTRLIASIYDSNCWILDEMLETELET